MRTKGILETEYARVTGHLPYRDFTFPITAVFSMGRRNAQVEPDLHRKQRLNRPLGLGQPEHHSG
jgi:hypothetical protein